MTSSDNGEYEWADYIRSQQSELYAPSWSEPVYAERSKGRKAFVIGFVALLAAGGIAFAEPWNKRNEPFLVLNGDIWSDWNVCDAYELEKKIRKNSLWGYLIMVDTFNEHKGDYCEDTDWKEWTLLPPSSSSMR